MVERQADWMVCTTAVCLVVLTVDEMASSAVELRGVRWAASTAEKWVASMDARSEAGLAVLTAGQMASAMVYLRADSMVGKKVEKKADRKAAMSVGRMVARWVFSMAERQAD